MIDLDGLDDKQLLAYISKVGNSANTLVRFLSEAQQATDPEIGFEFMARAMGALKLLMHTINTGDYPEGTRQLGPTESKEQVEAIKVSAKLVKN